jgi:hypothetical protein
MTTGDTIDESSSVWEPARMAACAVCGGGKAKRHCPALDRTICPTCCGTRRLVEIRCPDTCGWLQSARAHPHAALQRQQEQDAALAVPLVRGLDDTAYGVLMACLQAALAFKGHAAPPPLDDDLQQAAAALGATAETAMRGVLYEHQPESPVAARLARAMSTPLAEAAQNGARALEQATATAMRRLEGALQSFRRSQPRAGDAFFEFLARVLEPRLADAQSGRPLTPGADPALAPLSGVTGPLKDAPRIIIP